MIDLPSITRRTRPRAKSVTFRLIEPTKAQSDDLAAIYIAVVNHWRAVAVSVLTAYDPPELVTDSPPEITAALDAGQTGANNLILTLTPRLNSWIERLSVWHRRRWVANVLAGTGVSIDVFLSPAAVADDVAASLAWNIQLIRNVSDQTRDRIANSVWAGWRARTPRREIAREINAALGLGRDRSLRVASDQTLKLSSALDRARRLEAGIDTFIWRSSGKVHFRPEHKARNGKKYTEKTAPADRAGELPFCGCKEMAILELD